MNGRAGFAALALSGRREASSCMDTFGSGMVSY